MSTKKLIIVFFISFCCFAFGSYSQNTFTLNPWQINESCEKGAAGIQILDIHPADTLTITWSNGQIGYGIHELDAGDYNAHIVIKHKLDTTINYTINKEKCKVPIANHFTPNSDNYNDFWQIGNTQYYPNFELYVFNKWGQQVHSQKGSYTPWDGRWIGINVLDGTYYYVFYYDGANKHDFIKGDVTILR